ncbi:serine protease inhibitor-domain-containing protein [Aspergillus pseudonomiae]|uniref:Serine protease inhibitor-domain-containing protein n=1 Tax=Aspergillus pseudonomiae TaxID=1506151 RepID=A0A5N7D3I0_9EURO|nr:serine protease inhibitor-domain-containing protein [Aspergillus pseudonomiae]KAB8264797.1 serine protease inhibitor-domain-containing protein [Aspergillus pseudonomiae]KAE8400981.1 serine protease inhibitor-domain-containing protein [Aspergillus pseudonomiae]
MLADSSTDIAPTYVEYLRCFGAHLDHSFARLEDGTDCMNAWVSEHTNGLIPCMLNSQTLAHANIVLVNALVFKAAWQKRFDRKNTLKDFPFHVSTHRTCPVEMMLLHRHEILISRDRTYTAIRLPYTSSASSQLAFIAYLPTDASSLLHTLQALRRDGPPRRFEPTKLLQFGLPKINLRVRRALSNRFVTWHIRYPEHFRAFPLVSWFNISYTVLLSCWTRTARSPQLLQRW